MTPEDIDWQSTVAWAAEAATPLKGSVKLMDDTPDAYFERGLSLPKLPWYIDGPHIKRAIEHHNVTMETMAMLPGLLADPLGVWHSKQYDRYIVLLDAVDEQGDAVVAVIDPRGIVHGTRTDRDNTDCVFVCSVHGRANLTGQLHAAASARGIEFLNCPRVLALAEKTGDTVTGLTLAVARSRPWSGEPAEANEQASHSPTCTIADLEDGLAIRYGSQLIQIPVPLLNQLNLRAKATDRVMAKKAVEDWFFEHRYDRILPYRGDFIADAVNRAVELAAEDGSELQSSDYAARAVRELLDDMEKPSTGSD